MPNKMYPYNIVSQLTMLFYQYHKIEKIHITTLTLVLTKYLGKTEKLTIRKQS